MSERHERAHAQHHERNLHHTQTTLNQLNLGTLLWLTRMATDDGYAYPNSTGDRRSNNHADPTSRAALAHQNDPVAHHVTETWAAIQAIEAWAQHLATHLHPLIDNIPATQLKDPCREGWHPVEGRLIDGLCERHYKQLKRDAG